ncbi:xanthine dehydrogenase accessory protein XdhC [Branchiibius cervicis]|uniref:Xanthine dehydrogenase accessory protein XdhC n=1 Tax=Branchiibius cervicis TaxID=908252 RepID=A0ABW2APD9_9MICO
MSWVSQVAAARARRDPAVLVTVTSARGHVPRDAGAKMVVTATRESGSVGGGNLEASAIEKAREMIAADEIVPVTMDFALNEHAPVEHGTQCCGGEVTLLLEPIPPVPAIAVFGAGHVGLELSRILVRQDLDLHLIDSRAGELAPERLGILSDPVGTLTTHHAPVPELVLGQVPRGTHVLIMTHDHSEDMALCDAALRCGHLGSIGLIGSRSKWRRFEKRLLAEGHSPEAVAAISCPIGLPSITGKEPAVIALSVAAQLASQFAVAHA